MRPERALMRAWGLLVFMLVAPLVLGGCFAMQKDLDPMRSDISVMEKQFVELQREQAMLKARLDEGAPAQIASGVPDGSTERVRALELRLEQLERRVESLSFAGQAVPPPAMEPEPVMIEPEQGEASQPPVLVTPGVAPTMPSRASMAAEDIYKEAMTSYQSGDEAGAEAGFRRIIEEYPDNRLADNAAYWIGEAQFNRKEYTTALESFRRVMNDYPMGDKVPDAVYMMGRTYEELGQQDKAREAYNRVMDNYPYSDAARNARQRMGGN